MLLGILLSATVSFLVAWVILKASKGSDDLEAAKAQSKAMKTGGAE